MYICAAKQTLKTTLSNNWKKKEKNQKNGSMVDCNELKNKIRRLGKEKHKKTSEKLSKAQYHQKLKDIKSKLKSNGYFFWQNKFREIEN